MSIDDALRRKAELEHAVTRLLAAFEAETGLSVRGVHVRTADVSELGSAPRTRVTMTEVDVVLGRA